MSNSTRNLTPMEASQAALGVYGIRIKKDVVKAFEGTQLKNSFILDNNARFTGKSGIFRSESGFGVIGQGTGSRQGEVVIVTRGTKSGADWFNNAMAVSSMSSNSKAVHKGFNTIFNSFKNDLAIQLRPMNPTRVHCIGHSLGGALANLIAEWVAANGLGSPHVYTFGSPRVGKDSFAGGLTYRLGADCVNRAYHKTDIVPMIPVWPFVHGPQPGPSCFINSPGDYPGAKYHDMNLYISSVKSHKDWTSLRQRHPKTNMEKQVEKWLDSDSPLSLTGNTISMINSAILYVIKKLALAGIQFVIGEAVNVVDILANFLAKAARVAKKVNSLIGNLMRRILQALGKGVTAVKNITYSFVKWVLESLAISMILVAKMAVGITHQYL